MGKLARNPEMPAVLFLETARAGGETVALRARYAELREKVLEAGNDEKVLSVEEYCLYQILGELFRRGFVNTTSMISVPPRYMPSRRAKGEDKEAFLGRQAAARQAVQAAFESAFQFVMRPGVDEEGAAQINADVETRHQPYDRELGDPTAPAGSTDAAQNPPSDQQ